MKYFFVNHQKLCRKSWKRKCMLSNHCSLSSTFRPCRVVHEFSIIKLNLPNKCLCPKHLSQAKLGLEGTWIMSSYREQVLFAINTRGLNGIMNFFFPSLSFQKPPELFSLLKIPLRPPKKHNIIWTWSESLLLFFTHIILITKPDSS